MLNLFEPITGKSFNAMASEIVTKKEIVIVKEKFNTFNTGFMASIRSHECLYKKDCKHCTRQDCECSCHFTFIQL